MKRSRLIVLAVLLPLALPGISASTAAGVPDEQFVIGNPPTNDRYTGINLADDNSTKNTFSALEAFTADGISPDSRMLTRTTCSKVGAPGCEASKYFQYNAQLGMCKSESDVDCAVEVFATDSKGVRHTGTYIQAFAYPGEFSYQGDPSIDLPSGSSTFVVDFPDLPHQGGTNYLVALFMQGARGFDEAKFHIESFNAAIFAVSKVNGRYSVARPETIVRSDFKLRGRSSRVGGFNQDQSASRRSACVQTSTTECLLPWSMPSDVSFGFTLRMHESINGWLHGRLAEAKSSITKGADGNQLFTVEGKPVRVPGIYAWFKKEALPAPLATFYSDQPIAQVNANGLGWPSTDGLINDGPDGMPYSIMKENFGYMDGSFREVMAWIQAVSDRATYAPTIWAVKSIDSMYSDGCMKGTDTLSGIVSTNATMYVSSPPQFNKEDQSLDYKVAAPHNLPDGTEFKGSYDLIIRSDVARCIYGFSNAPISAKISIISSDGTTQVATTTFNERDGWMYLVARNFTFSSPTVKIKLIQEKAPETPAQQVKPAAQKVTITCIKGKTSKKITGVKPVCPAGYKKK